MNRSVKYIGYYDKPELSIKENRTFFVAATNKMTYIGNVIAKNGCNVEIISPSPTSNTKGFYGRRVNKISDNIILKLCPSVGANNIVAKGIRKFLSQGWLYLQLLLHTKSSDTVFVYHSLALMRTVRICKVLKRFKLILEVEEIYGDVVGSEVISKREIKFTQIADGFLFPTELLNKKINVKHKPAAIIHGTYQAEPNRHCEFGDGKIHVVYAGTFDPQKGGAAAAVAAAEFLDERYHVHIIGFGKESEKPNLLKAIHDVSKLTQCTITYDGLLSGEDYIRFIQSCDIGLSTQNPALAFNDTSFPSKVLSYLANGLRVVSIRIKALETSAVNDVLCYYDDNSPKVIAEAIKSVDCSKPYDSRGLIEKLNCDFSTAIKRLLEKL